MDEYGEKYIVDHILEGEILKIELEHPVGNICTARIKNKKGDYIYEYDSPVIFRKKNQQEAEQAAKEWIKTSYVGV